MQITGRRPEAGSIMTFEPRIRHSAGEDDILAAFAERRRDLAGFKNERQEAIERIARYGLPTRRDEAWKFSDARAALKNFPAPASAPGKAELAEARARPGSASALEAYRLVFVNGRYQADLSAGDLPADIYFQDLVQAFERGDSYLEAHYGRLTTGSGDTALALNTAFAQGGALLRLAPHAKIDKPVHLDFRFAGAAASIFPRLLILVGDGAELTLLHTMSGPDGIAYQSHAAAEITLGAAARLVHVTDEAEGESAITLAHDAVVLGREASYETFALDRGAAFQRRALSVRFDGEGARLALNGAVLAKSRQHADTTLLVDHAVPHCASREIFKYVLCDEAHGVFQGKIIVRPDAQKTDGRMNARGLMLGEAAEFSAKPELEIFADDVQCAHGATAGEIDEDLAFYLRSRGLPAADAKALLVRAFVGEAVEALSDEGLRAYLLTRIEDWLDAALQGKA